MVEFIPSETKKNAYWVLKLILYNRLKRVSNWIKSVVSKRSYLKIATYLRKLNLKKSLTFT